MMIKKIIISAIMVSSFALSGDMWKCTEAYEMVKKYDNISQKYWAEVRRSPANTSEWFEASNEVDMNEGLARGWYRVVEKECKDVLYREDYSKLLRDIIKYKSRNL